jgi:hypothetical protein
MQFSLSSKRTAKEAWDAIVATRIGSDRARKSTLSGRAWPSSQVRTLMTLLGGKTYGELHERLGTKEGEKDICKMAKIDER